MIRTNTLCYNNNDKNFSIIFGGNLWGTVDTVSNDNWISVEQEDQNCIGGDIECLNEETLGLIDFYSNESSYPPELNIIFSD